jgi:hypothetical protein
MELSGGCALIDTIYRCEICGEESDKPLHWLVVNCNSAQLTVYKWTKEAADALDARHYCGEAHAQVYISRWLEAACS